MSITIEITTKKQLDIYMNPQRQRLLKEMSIYGKPITPKQLSEILKISPSSVTYHLKKLQELGIVELDHTEMVHGICAKYYKNLSYNVNLKSHLKDDMSYEKKAFIDYMMQDVWNGFKTYLDEMDDKKELTGLEGDLKSGILYLTKEEIKEMKQLIEKFQNNHAEPTEDTIPWEYVLIAYPKKEVK